MRPRWLGAICVAVLCVLLLLAWHFRPVVQVVQNLGGAKGKTYAFP